MRLRRRCIAYLAALLTAGSAAADERILAFASDIAIRADGSMTVTETIRVSAEGVDIRRGIFRDFPTDYADRLGNRYSVAFDVVGVERDGRPEPWFTERRSNGVRLYVGDADVSLDPGEYEYSLRYSTNRQIGFFDDHDELYWNVTGNGWGLPIDTAMARVTLPGSTDTESLSIEGYTGAYGSAESAVRSSIVDGMRATIEATRPLGPREGLTLVLSFPKGLVAEPTAVARFGRLLRDNIGLLLALCALLVVAGYFTAAWHRYGRDPEPGPVFAHYEPPPGVSPAAARHLLRMGYDNRTFTSAIIGLAVKGRLSIDEDGGDYRLVATEGGTAALTAGERALLDSLFRDAREIALEKSNHRPVRRAIAAHRAALRREHLNVYFATNLICILPAIVVIIGTLAVIAVLRAISPFAIAALVLTGLLIPLFGYLLKAPTRIGRRLLDQIDGFRLYLDVAEKDELALKNPPEKTPALFEAFLPFALALGVEQRWAEKFDAVFAKLQAGGQPYTPAWYHGDAGIHHFGRNAASMSAAVAAAVDSAIAAASVPPGSSSGSGGGGFSGGGGGGGGGGGW